MGKNGTRSEPGSPPGSQKSNGEGERQELVGNEGAAGRSKAMGHYYDQLMVVETEHHRMIDGLQIWQEV